MSTLKDKTLTSTYDQLVKRLDTYSATGSRIELMEDDADMAGTALYLGSHTDGTSNQVVGIGEAAPAAPLEIRKDSDGTTLSSNVLLQLTNQASNALNKRVGISFAPWATGTTSALVEAVSDHVGAGTALSFATHDGSATFREHMRITRNGAVGIGIGDLDTTSVWQTSYRTLQVGIQSSGTVWGAQALTQNATGTTDGMSAHWFNCYDNAAGTKKVNAAGFCGRWTFLNSTGVLRFENISATASAGATATFQDVLNIGSDGYIGVGAGVGTPSRQFEIYDKRTSGKHGVLRLTRNGVAHGISDETGGLDSWGTDTDCFGMFGIESDAASGGGGLVINGYKENHSSANSALCLRAHLPSGASVDQTTTDDSHGMAQVQVYLGELGGPAAADNIFAIRSGHGGNACRMLMKGNGAFYLDISAHSDLPDTDTEDDAQLCRALAHHSILEKTGAIETSLDAGFIKDKWDDFVAYNGDKLADMEVLGRNADGKPNSMMNMQQMSRLHNSAIWQLYTETQKVKEIMYETIKELVGKKEADKRLSNHNIKLLN